MSKRKKVSKLPLIVFLILVLFSFISIAVVNLINFEDYVIADVLEVSGSTVIIGKNCTAIVQETSPERAQSIETGIKGIIEQRPNTHDIFAETLKSFNITLEYVTLDNFENGIYYSNLYLKSKDKVLKLDVKPSDAIALALRANSTIYINKTLLQEVGKNICD
jgi:bifunctional DNase/RNase